MAIYKTKNISGDILSYYNDALSTPLSISAIKNELSKPIIRPRFRLHWLNEDETVKDILPMEDIVSGSYNENYQNGQRRNISLTLHNEDKRYTPSINGIWDSVKFSFESGIEIDGGEVIWFPKGIYIVSNVTSSNSSGGKTVNVDLTDKYSIFEGRSGTFETTYSISPGITIQDIITDILNYNRGDGTRLDPKPMVYNSAFLDKKTQATITKEAGSNFGEVLNELATQLSAEVFYDTLGNLTWVPINETSDDIDKPIIYQLYDVEGDFNNNDLSFGMSDIVNRVIVTGATVNGGVCRATALNNDPSSPMCYQRIGYRTADVINDTNITSDILAQERADYELRQKLILKTTASVTTMFNPLLMVNNMVGITDEFYGFEQEKFLIQSLSYSLDASGTMSLSLTNARNLPFVVGGR